MVIILTASSGIRGSPSPKKENRQFWHCGQRKLQPAVKQAASRYLYLHSLMHRSYASRSEPAVYFKSAGPAPAGLAGYEKAGIAGEPAYRIAEELQIASKRDPKR